MKREKTGQTKMAENPLPASTAVPRDLHIPNSRGAQKHYHTRRSEPPEVRSTFPSCRSASQGRGASVWDTAVLIPWLTSRNATQLRHPERDRKGERETTAFSHRERLLAILTTVTAAFELMSIFRFHKTSTACLVCCCSVYIIVWTYTRIQYVAQGYKCNTITFSTLGQAGLANLCPLINKRRRILYIQTLSLPIPRVTNTAVFNKLLNTFCTNLTLWYNRCAGIAINSKRLKSLL